MKKILLTLFILFITVSQTSAATVWLNDARALFQNNGAIVMAINIRTFNAKDINNNGIIEERIGEERGNFINAIDRLDELAMQGVNTIHLLPITPVGKIKALGTAGSLYALNSFNEINPQLASPKSRLKVKDQAIRFIDEAHKRKIRVIVDMPSCASYDLYLKKTDLFLRNSLGTPVTLADWNDVRVLDAGTQSRVNLDLYNEYVSFIDMLIEIGADGVVASNAYIKPYKFWADLISYARAKSPQFVFVAQARDNDVRPVKNIPFTPYDQLLLAGFDSYYAGYSRFSDWTVAKQLYEQVKFNQQLFSKYKVLKSAMGSFATIDEVSPMLINGAQYSAMLAWLNATLPVNAYYVDGFQSGDDYTYPWENKRAEKTYTDDDLYFVHRGKLDIFNFSRKPGASNGYVLQNFILANKTKNMINKILVGANFVPLYATSDNVFAFARSNKHNSIVVIGNMDFQNMQNVKVSIPRLNEKVSVVPIKIEDIPIVLNSRINVILAPGEVQVLLLRDFSIK